MRDQKYDHCLFEFTGVFDSKQKAIDACRDENYCVAPIKLNYFSREWCNCRNVLKYYSRCQRPGNSRNKSDEFKCVNYGKCCHGSYSRGLHGNAYATSAGNADALDGYRASDLVNSLVGFKALYKRRNQTITTGGTLTLPHGLSRTPAIVQAFLVCTMAEFGYSVGDVICTSVGKDTAPYDNGFTAKIDTTNINIRFSLNPSVFGAFHYTTNAGVALTNSHWALVISAWG